MPSPNLPSEDPDRVPLWRRGALVLGPALAALLWLAPSPAELSEPAWRLVGLAAWMVVWWLSEAAPLPATALLPLVFMPLLGIRSEGETAASYAHPLIFLFLGGFILAGAMQRCGLHRRLALGLVSRLGDRLGAGPSGVVGGFMAASAFLSMWISNTATAMLMYTLGRSLLDSLEDTVEDRAGLRRFGVALMLAIAYACSIGGAATLIGTPPNALLASILSDSYGYELTMGRWLGIGLPYMLLFLPIAWLWLTRVACPLTGFDLTGARRRLGEELERLGPASPTERFVSAVFTLTAAAWVLRSFLADWTGWAWSDTVIAIAAGLILLTVPVSWARGRFAVDWHTVEELPWGVLLLFGGGLALAGAFQSTGLAEVLGGSVSRLSGVNPWWIVLAVAAGVVLLTELTSNTATAATFLPLVAAVAVGLGQAPILLAAPVALAASAAFMMPVATPPNAIVFAYPGLRIGHMVRAGALMNLVSVLLIVTLLWLLGPLVLGL